MAFQRAFAALVLIGSIHVYAPWNARAQEPLKWTSADGKEVQGQFVRIDDKSVVLKLDSGKEIDVPLVKLSLESHLQALKLANPEAFSKELIKAAIRVEAAKIPDSVPIASVVDSPFTAEASIDSFLSTAIGQWKKGNNFIAWHMLPPGIQNQLVKVYSDSFKTVGAEDLNQIHSLLKVATNLAETKRDWILDSPLALLFPKPRKAENATDEWALAVGMLKKTIEQSRWDPTNFEPNAIAAWLASNSELTAFVRQASPEMSDVSFNVISQSADRAQVEFTTAGAEPKKVNFQKLGNIWVIPESMNTLQQQLKAESTDRTYSQRLKTLAGLAPAVLPILTQADQAKTHEEFKKAVQSPLLQAAAAANRSDSEASQANGFQFISAVPVVPTLPDLIAGPERVSKAFFGSNLPSGG